MTLAEELRRESVRLQRRAFHASVRQRGPMTLAEAIQVSRTMTLIGQDEQSESEPVCRRDEASGADRPLVQNNRSDISGSKSLRDK